jgi:Spy/CpxP family protein refolding chaperone
MTFRSRKITPLLLLVLLFAAAFTVPAQEPQNQAGDNQDPIQQLRLSPEQRQRIRIITEQTKDERQMVNRRFREANFALDQALDSSPIDDNVVEQKMAELNAAQAAQLRLRVHTEMRIRRLLSPEQLATLHALKLQIKDFMGQRPNNPVVRPGQEGLRPNNRNGIVPIQPRRGNMRPNPRP